MIVVDGRVQDRFKDTISTKYREHVIKVLNFYVENAVVLQNEHIHFYKKKSLKHEPDLAPPLAATTTPFPTAPTPVGRITVSTVTP